MLHDHIAVEVKDGRIFIDSEDQGLECDDRQHMRLTARDIRKSHTVTMLDQNRLENRCLRGSGTLEGTLGLVGQTHSVKNVEVVIQTAPAERPDLDWHTFIGASFADGEIFDEDTWALAVRIPGDVWKRLEFDYDAEQAREIDLIVEAPLWCKRVPFFSPRQPDLKLTPDRNGGGGATRGRTTSITWRDGPARGEHVALVPAKATGADTTALPQRVVSTVIWCLPAIVALLLLIAAKG